MRAAVVGLLVAAAFILCGCQYLLGGMMGAPIMLPGESFDPGDFGSFDPGDFGSFDPNDPLLDAAADGDVHEGVGHRHHRRQDDDAGTS